MLADVDLAQIGALIGDRRRAGMLLALLGGEDLPAGEVGARVGASSSLASAHLNRLREGGLVTVRRVGRRRLYRIAGPDIAEALEALAALAPSRPARSLRESRQGEALRQARTCYDHLAGELGVGLTEALRRQGVLRFGDAGFALTDLGHTRLSALGVDVEAAHAGRRTFIRHCVDWTERRPHLAGALGAAITTRCFELDWVKRRPGSRAVEITPMGAREFRARFGLG